MDHTRDPLTKLDDDPSENFKTILTTGCNLLHLTDLTTPSDPSFLVFPSLSLVRSYLDESLWSFGWSTEIGSPPDLLNGCVRLFTRGRNKKNSKKKFKNTRVSFTYTNTPCTLQNYFRVLHIICVILLTP